MYAISPKTISNTVIAIAYKKQFVGYITIADKIKEDAKNTITKLHRQNVKVTMLSGDKDSIVQLVASELGIPSAFGDLLPEDKVEKVKVIKAKNESVAFVGDGVNDAPVVALSDVGIAMGGLGSDATIETADIVIQDDNPIKIPLAIEIGKQTKRIVWQNIILAFGIKIIVLILGAGGLATMWEAVFADVGVALLAILNAVRVQRMKFPNFYKL
jgi:Cd2+/Zn2+-exporting ATPase